MYGLQFGDLNGVSFEEYSTSKEYLYSKYKNFKTGVDNFAVFTNLDSGGVLRKGLKKATKFILGKK